MPRTRQHNVTAAQWSANGTALGSPDLTLPTIRSSHRTCSPPPSSASACPSTYTRRSSETLAHGEALDTSLADAVAWR